MEKTAVGPREKENDQVIIKFQDAVNLDPISIALAVDSFLHNYKPININWPKDHDRLKRLAEELLPEAKQYQSSDSRFYGIEIPSVREFVINVTNILRNWEDPYHKVGSRIPILLSGMRDYWDEKRMELALARYLKLASFRILFDRAYSMALEWIYEKYLKNLWVGPWIKDWRMDPGEKIARLFDTEGPMHFIEILLKADQPTKRRDIWVPASSFRRGPMVASDTQLWEPEFAIPQVEYELAMEGDMTEIKYCEQIRILKVRE